VQTRSCKGLCGTTEQSRMRIGFALIAVALLLPLQVSVQKGVRSSSHSSRSSSTKTTKSSVPKKSTVAKRRSNGKIKRSSSAVAVLVCAGGRLETTMSSSSVFQNRMLLLSSKSPEPGPQFFVPMLAAPYQRACLCASDCPNRVARDGTRPRSSSGDENGFETAMAVGVQSPRCHRFVAPYDSACMQFVLGAGVGHNR
jgi:hypothetical protein